MLHTLAAKFFVRNSTRRKPCLVKGLTPRTAELYHGSRTFHMTTVAAVAHDEQHARLETKLKRELGETILGLLADGRTEDILLNPDSSLWVKRIGEGFVRAGEMATTTAMSALSTIAA